MYGLRAIILSLAATAPLVQGAEQGSQLASANSVSPLTHAVNSVRAAAVTPAVSPAPTEGPLFEGAQWTSGDWTSGTWTSTWSSWTNEDQDQDQDQDNERRAAAVTPAPTVGPLFEGAQWTSGDWTSGERTSTWSSWTNEDQDNEQGQDNERRAAAVTPAPSVGPSFKGAQWTSGDWTSGERTSTWSSWTNEDQDQEQDQDNERRVAPTMFVEPALGPFFKSIISRLRDLESHATVTVTVPADEPVVTAPGRPIYTGTEPWDFSVSVLNTNEVTRPTLPVKAAHVATTTTTDPAMATYLRKNAGQRIVTSRAANSTNQTATTSSTSRPTKVPPTSGAVVNAAAPVMGAVAVFIAACVLAL